MADDDIRIRIAEASQSAKLAVLRRIEALATETNSANVLQSLGYAYSLVIGAAPSHLPGGPINVSVSK